MTWASLARTVTAAQRDYARQHGDGVQRTVSARWNRPNHLDQIALTDFYGLAGEMAPVTRAEAMSVPAMARCRHIITATIARLPLVVRTGSPDPYPYSALIDQPDPARTRFNIMSDTVDSLLFYGAAVWAVTDRYAPATNGARPRSARFVALAEVTYDAGVWAVSGQPVAAADLLWFEGPHEGVLNFAGRALRAAVNLDRAAARRASNPVPAVELHQTTDDVMTDDEIAELVASWERALAASGVAYTNAAVELRTHGAAPEQLLLQGRNTAAVDIARDCSIPAALIDASTPGTSSTYSNAETKGRELIDYGLAAYMAPVAERLSMDDVLAHGVTAEWDTDPLTRADFAGRMAAYAAALASGIYSTDELRALERGHRTENT